MLVQFLTTFLVLITPTTSFNKSVTECEGGIREWTNLWRIQTEPPSFFFGTIHVPYTEVWPGISQKAKSAFQLAEKTYFELGKDFPTPAPGFN